MDTSVDNFLALAYSSYGEDAPFSYLLSQVDPNAFSTADLPFWSCFIDCPTFPTDSAGEFALGLDYAIFASGLGPTVDPLINSIPELVYFPEQVLVLLALLFG